MTSTTEPCACGCGLVIKPSDDHPWFKTQGCQSLWQASLGQPEDQRRQWVAEQRFFTELIYSMPWGERGIAWQYEISRNYMIDVANVALADTGAALRPFHWEANPDLREDMLEDALRILVHRYEKTRATEWFSGYQMVPEWAILERASAATLADLRR